MEDTLGMRIRVERIRQHLGQRALARQVGLTPAGLWNIEHDRSDPSTRSLRALAQALGVSTDYLVGLTSERRPGRA